MVSVDREELRKALEDVDYLAEQGNSISPSYRDKTLFALAAAARERLAQLDGDALVVDIADWEWARLAIDELDLTIQDRDQWGNLAGGFRYVAASEVLDALAAAAKGEQ